MPITVGLVMMASNEEAVIGRALRSVRDHIDWWTVVDTGSSDRTETIVHDTLKGIPGQLLHEPWIDFGHGRSTILNANRGKCDFSLMLDADDEIRFKSNDWKPKNLEATAHYIEVEADRYRFNRLHLFRTDLPWKFEGRVHERPVLSEQWTNRLLDTIVYVQHFCEGSHSSRSDKFIRDAEIMREDWERTDDPRWLFLLAQSYRDAGMKNEAVKYYEQRAINKSGWQEERYISLLEMGKLTETPEPLLMAYAFDSKRIEALVWAANVYRTRGLLPLALLFAERALEISRTNTWSIESLHTELDCWEWRIHDELALICHRTGDPSRAMREGREALVRAVPGLISDGERIRLEQNLEQYKLDSLRTRRVYNVSTL